MMPMNFEKLFTKNTLLSLFPSERTDHFFEALFGDPTEGSYDINLTFKGYSPELEELTFDLELHERPGRCLACNLTYGLPEVFSRHPVINIKGLVAEIEKRLEGAACCKGWKLRHTREMSRRIHVIPLVITLEPV